MKVALQADVLAPMVDLSLIDPGAIFVEIVYPFDETFGDPAIHYFQVLRRAGRTVSIAGIAKEFIPGSGFERDALRRVRPVKHAFVRACSVCRDADPPCRPDDETIPLDFAAIDVARWNAYDGTGAQHAEGSPHFEHPFADYIPTATHEVRFLGAEPFVRTGPYSPLLILFPSGDVRPATSILLPPRKAPAPHD